jgi:hypothetical protein
MFGPLEIDKPHYLAYRENKNILKLWIGQSVIYLRLFRNFIMEEFIMLKYFHELESQ